MSPRILAIAGVALAGAYLLSRNANAAGAPTAGTLAGLPQYTPIRVSGGKLYDRLGNQVTADGKLVVANGGYAIGADGALAVPQRSKTAVA